MGGSVGRPPQDLPKAWFVVTETKCYRIMNVLSGDDKSVTNGSGSQTALSIEARDQPKVPEVLTTRYPKAKIFYMSLPRMTVRECYLQRIAHLQRKDLHQEPSGVDLMVRLLGGDEAMKASQKHSAKVEIERLQKDLPTLAPAMLLYQYGSHSVVYDDPCDRTYYYKYDVHNLTIDNPFAPKFRPMYPDKWESIARAVEDITLDLTK